MTADQTPCHRCGQLFATTHECPHGADCEPGPACPSCASLHPWLAQVVRGAIASLPGAREALLRVRGGVS